MPAEQLLENIQALVGTLLKLKPASAKGTYLRGAALSSTMGPGIRLDPSALVRQGEA
jgi:large subunit ribosomal protein L1